MGPLPTATVATTVLLAVSITETVFERIGHIGEGLGLRRNSKQRHPKQKDQARDPKQ